MHVGLCCGRFFGPSMTGFEVGLIPRLLSGTGKIDKIGKKNILVLGAAHSHG